MLKPLFHLSAVGINSFVMLYDQAYIKVPLPVEGMAGLPLQSRSMFLTLWCLVLQTLYHAIAFLNDLSQSKNFQKKPTCLKRILDRLFALAFPLALHVTIFFWALYFTDRELIFPKHIEILYPPLFNHVMHTTISVFMVIEMLTSKRNFPSRKNGVIVLTTFLLTYTFWFFYIYAVSGGWVYPFYEGLSWNARIGFLGLSFMTSLGLYIASEKLNHAIWSRNRQSYTNGVNGKSK